MKNLLIKLGACEDAKEWAGEKTWPEIYSTCHRGDWLLWLFKKTNPEDLQTLTLAKGHCANTVRHLMKDQRSIDAVDAAISFGEGKISIEELRATAAAAAAAISFGEGKISIEELRATAAAAAAYAAAAYADAAAAYAAANASAAAAADAAARKQNQQLTADIVRKFIPIGKFKIEIS